MNFANKKCELTDECLVFIVGEKARPRLRDIVAEFEQRQEKCYLVLTGQQMSYSVVELGGHRHN